MTEWLIAIGALITGPIVLLMLILGIAILINVVMIVRVKDAFDRAMADWIDATTDSLIQGHKMTKDEGSGYAKDAK